MIWLNTVLFAFTREFPDRMERKHLMAIGWREDRRVYFAWCSIPERIADRLVAYQELQRKFDSYLFEPVTSGEFTKQEYQDLVEHALYRYKGWVLDDWPDGE